MSIVEYRKDPKSFFNGLYTQEGNQLPTPIQYELESRYRSTEHGAGFADLSLLVIKAGKISACVFCHKYGEVTGFNGSGANIFLFTDDATAIKTALDGLLIAAGEQKLTSVRVADTKSAQILSALGLECYNRNGAPRYALRGQIDLGRSEALIHSDLRKSYKSLVNKGRAEMAFKAVTKNNFDEGLFRDFENFHFKTAGKKTRSSESWNAQMEMIREGAAELLMGYLPSHGLVSSALFTDFGPETSYAVAVYNRDLFDRPLAHANVYEGILRAKKRGQTIFNLGIMPVPDSATGKELNIARFKKGFVPSLTGIVEWTIPLSNTLREKI